MPDYRVSLWNYTHYVAQGTLEEAVGEIAQAGFGVELWPGWHDTPDLFDPSQRERLRALLKGMRSSWHSGGVKDFEGHKRQVDCAADVGSDVIVVHPGNMRLGDDGVDIGFARDMVAYARERGVTLCLENGDLHVIERGLEVDDLKLCLDTGHTYQGKEGFGMPAYIDVMKPRLAHLHIQDTLPEGDHYTPGVGTIPREHWEYMLRTLDEIKFHGAWVFEIRPLRPLRIAEQTVAFLGSLRHGCTRQ
jgi:sugar phosphate isomerase/epimerase